jgi:hypothetical protein
MPNRQRRGDGLDHAGADDADGAHANLGRAVCRSSATCNCKQVLAAAREAIEDAVSTTRLFLSPGVIYATVRRSNTKCIDIDGDGHPDLTVALTPTPTCVKAQSSRTRS